MIRYKVLHKETVSSTVIFLVHGRAGNIDVMKAFTSILPQQATVITIEAPTADPKGGFSWWAVGEDHPWKTHGKIEALDMAERVLGNLKEIIKWEKLPDSQLLAVGFSQGAALLSIIIQKDPCFFSKAALLAGFVVNSENSNFTVGSLEAQRRPFTSVFMTHGSNDKVVPFELGEKGAEILIKKGYSVEFIKSDAEHKVSAEAMRGLRTWLAN